MTNASGRLIAFRRAKMVGPVTPYRMHFLVRATLDERIAKAEQRKKYERITSALARRCMQREMMESFPNEGNGAVLQ